MSRIFDDARGPITATTTGSCDDGDSLSVEFKCGAVQGWIDVQDGVFGQKVAVWLYDTPVNRKVADVDVAAMTKEETS